MLLKWYDNTTACTCVNRNRKHSMIVQRLCRLCVGLLMGINIDIWAKWVSTHLNVVTDGISRCKDENDGDFEYTKLKET